MNRTPPQIGRLLSCLTRNDVRFVIFGSAGALLYGAKIAPGDLDICPALDRRNLERLAKALAELEACPRIIPGWLNSAMSEQWTGDLLTEENFDHLFQTSFGDLDIVPRPYGPNGKIDRFAFEQLDERANTLTVFGTSVRVAEVKDLVASKMSRHRTKDVEALPELERLLKLFEN